LAVLDRETHDLVVLELKATFDKFRTHTQLRNYVHQRANFPKAIIQAQRAASALEEGRWQLRDLFGRSAPTRARSVTPGVLTWWDIFNPTLGEANEILRCNFSTFAYVLSAAEGDLRSAITAIRELSSIFCEGVLLQVHARVDGEAWDVRREVQTDMIPPVIPRTLSPLSAQLLDRLRQMPRFKPEGEQPVLAAQPERFSY
jgi:hypothetical protein